MLQDIRYAMRAMKHSPGFAALGVLILGLGIGSTTAVFSIVNAALLRPLPYADPSRLVALFRITPGSTREGAVALRDVEAWRRQSRSLSALGSFVFTELPVSTGTESYSLVTAAVDPELLRTLGVQPMLGANFSGSGSTEPDRSAIVTYRFWRDALGADRGAVGRTIVVNGSRYTLDGVLPASFQFPRADASFFDKDVDLLIPVVNIADQWGRDNSQWFVIGRLGGSVTEAQAQTELAAIDGRIPRPAASGTPRAVRMSALSDLTTRGVRSALLLTFGISIVLLLIACVNVMSLWFSKAAARAREIAIRKAIGAGLGRLLRQMIIESACLTFSAGVLGVLLAMAFQNALVSLSPFHLPITGRIDIDARVLAFTLAMCAAAAVVSGVLPALHSSRDRDHLLSGSGTRTSGGRLFARVQRVLTTAQVALGLALLTSAGLLINSLWRLSDVNPGFRSHDVVGFTFDVPSDHPRDQIPALYTRMLDGIGALPGVQSVGLVNFLPPEQRKGVFVPVTIEGEAADPAHRAFCNFAMTSDGYFATLGIPLVTGRGFTDADSSASAPVAIVNDVFVKRFFPDGRVLGRRITTAFDGRPREIVGVIGAMRDRGLSAASVPAVYAPFRQFAFGYGSIAVRASVPPSTLVPAIRARIAQIDRSVPLQNFETLDDRLRRSLGEPRFYTVIAATCAGFAIFFVALGLYGVMAYSVSRRTREIGVRVAVGAQPSAIRRMILGQGLAVGVSGAAIGAALSFWLTRLLRGLLFEVKPADPLTFAASIGLVIGVTLLACYVPARRASRVDPIVALRQE
ncbi:MAG: ABC transporter permease [Vicinamibacterales bacterium]